MPRRVLLGWIVIASMVAFVIADAAIVAQWIRTSALGEIINRKVARITTNGWKDFGYMGAVFANANVSVAWKRVRVQRGGDPGLTRSDETTWSQKRAQVGEAEPGDGPAWVRELGLRWKYRSQTTQGRSSMIDQSLWIQISFINLLLLSLLAKAALLYSHRRITRPLRRARVGLCGRCGYNLRATPDRCPECGTVPTTAPQTAT